MNKNILTIFLGFLLYAIALFDLSFISEDLDLSISNIYESFGIVVAWLICFLLFYKTLSVPLTRYWWVIFSVFIILFRLFPMLFALMSWSTNGFAP